MTKIKICGLSTPETITAAIDNKADFIGFVFYEPSPRHLEIETAKYLSSQVPDTVKTVGLFVNPDDDYLTQVLNEVPLDFIQLHGHETSERALKIKEKFKRPIIKSFPISSKKDLSAIKDFDGIANWLLFDAKPETLPGGNGKSFDWNILKDFKSKTPWMLAGGLNPDNVTSAIRILNPDAVDVSSGVETATQGKKDTNKIHSFILAAKKA